MDETSHPAVLKRAEQVRAQIQRDAETNRNAIAAVLGGNGTTEKTPARKPTSTKSAPASKLRPRTAKRADTPWTEAAQSRD